MHSTAGSTDCKDEWIELQSKSSRRSKRSRSLRKKRRDLLSSLEWLHVVRTSKSILHNSNSRMHSFKLSSPSNSSTLRGTTNTERTTQTKRTQKMSSRTATKTRS